MVLNTPLKQRFLVLMKVHNSKIDYNSMIGSTVKAMESIELLLGCFCLLIDVPNANANAPNVVHTLKIRLPIT